MQERMEVPEKGEHSWTGYERKRCFNNEMAKRVEIENGLKERRWEETQERTENRNDKKIQNSGKETVLHVEMVETVVQRNDMITADERRERIEEGGM